MENDKNVTGLEKKSAINLYLKESKPLLPHIVDMQVDIAGNASDNGSDKSIKNTIKSIYKHKESVHNKLIFLAKELINRAKYHDNSKLEYPEINYLLEMDKEPNYPYGSEEYFDKMKRWDVFFQSHYSNPNNRHHPDHFENGIYDMTIVDLCEFMIDIISYFDNLSVSKAIDTVEKQQQRFGFSDQLTFIIKNTLIQYYTSLGKSSSLYNEYVNHYINKNEIDTPDKLTIIDETGILNS